LICQGLAKVTKAATPLTITQTPPSVVGHGPAGACAKVPASAKFDPKIVANPPDESCVIEGVPPPAPMIPPRKWSGAAL
jgi:hypothetical protein